VAASHRDTAIKPLTAACLALLLLAFATAAPAADEAQLQALRARIEQLERDLNETRATRDSASEDLRAHEQHIDKLLRAQRQTRTKLKVNARMLETAHARAAHEQLALAGLRAGFESDMRTAYAAGRQDHLKLLLSQDDPARTARTLVYFRYITQARAERMLGIRASLARLDGVESEIRDHGRELTALRADQSQSLADLEDARRERTTLLAGLNREVKNRAREIERLRADQARLERLLGELATALPPVTVPGDRGARFGQLRGRLPPPTRGHVSARFGETKSLGDLRWRGIFLDAPEGQDVVAVARGRVAYAGWLRGFGLLLILDHGDGYMTLYGHNQTLVREVGDWVEAGEAVAAVGSTGDAPRAGLYFEIRHQGEPSDPLTWIGMGRGLARAR
jgi:murein hydrolase activator